ncbi:hypothetical protein B0H17DRAFT_1337068 [Mycena rosella]|uniref:Uncharacterized protein n=1 Tax=Mycena rosella TaxID=1033263 RepID=A0AAD7CU31_MYCRO|nr:hypothetical protein B0H17DRAFT_1337068 [Mycena rosella]
MPLCRHLRGPSCRAALAIGRHLLYVPCILPAPASRPVRTVPGVNVTSRTDDVRRHSHRTSSPVARLEDRDRDNIVATPSSSLSATEKHCADLRPGMGRYTYPCASRPSPYRCHPIRNSSPPIDRGGVPSRVGYLIAAYRLRTRSVQRTPRVSSATWILAAPADARTMLGSRLTGRRACAISPPIRASSRSHPRSRARIPIPTFARAGALRARWDRALRARILQYPVPFRLAAPLPRVRGGWRVARRHVG